jgi:hypothetical protein
MSDKRFSRNAVIVLGIASIVLGVGLAGLLAYCLSTVNNANSRISALGSEILQEGWTKTYGGAGYDYACSLVQTNDGGYCLAGYTLSFGAGDADFWLVKTDPSGVAQWNQTYGGTSDDKAFALVQTIDGGFALAGYTTSFGVGANDFWLVKTDVSGAIMWNQTYGGIGDDEARSLIQTDDDGYALAGYTNSSGAGNNDFWLVKTDMFGEIQWNMTYGGTGFDEAYALVQNNDGGYAFAGWTTSYGYGYRDFYLVKTDSSGIIMWNMTYGGTGFDEAYALVQNNDGGYSLAGRTSSFGAGSDDGWLVRTDASGTAMWNQTYGGTSVDDVWALVKTSDGGYALAGSTQSFGAGAVDLWLVKTDVNGGAEWNMTCGGAMYEDYAQSLVQTSDGGYALAGYTYSFADLYDFWLVKTDINGVVSELHSAALLFVLFFVTSATMVLARSKLQGKQEKAVETRRSKAISAR